MSIKARLCPRPGDLPTLVLHCTHARYVWNLALEQRNFWRPGRARITVVGQQKDLARARQASDWLRAGSSSVQQQAVRDLDRAFTNWWRNPSHFRRPTWRCKNINEGCYVRDLHVRRITRRHGEIHIPKLGWVRFIIHRAWSDYQDATSARVTARNGAWHVAFTTPPPAKTTAGTGAVVGIDRGAVNTIATTDGLLDSIPGLTIGEQTRFLALQRRLARQTTAAKKARRRRSECTNRTKTLDSLATIRRRLDDRRTDWVEQTTTTLARTYNLIALERLNTHGMTRRPRPKPDHDNPGVFLPNGATAKAALNRAILASRWGQLQQRLADKTPKGVLILVDPRNTSRQCNACGHTAADNRESQAVFVCQACGHAAHADTNAARNILDRALITNPGTPGDRPHQPAHHSRGNQPTREGGRQ